jgi:hypothetical protein
MLTWTLLHGLRRILNQIHENLLDLERIGRGHDRTRVELQRERRTGLIELRAAEVTHLSH